MKVFNWASLKNWFRSIFKARWFWVEATAIVLVALLFVRVVQNHKTILSERAPRVVDRTPASIEKTYDFSFLKGTELVAAARKRVVDSAKVEPTADGEEFLLIVGNFVVPTEDESQKDFACGFYDRVQVTFEAEGMAISGEKPSFSLETSCQVGTDINEIMPLRIPVSRIKHEKPTDSDIKFFVSGQAVSMGFSNIPTQGWPKQWVLREITFKNSSLLGRVLRIGQEAYREAGQKPISMNW